MRVGTLRKGREILLDFWSNLNSKLVMIKEASREGSMEQGGIRSDSGKEYDRNILYKILKN